MLTEKIKPEYTRKKITLVYFISLLIFTERLKIIIHVLRYRVLYRRVIIIDGNGRNDGKLL